MMKTYVALKEYLKRQLLLQAFRYLNQTYLTFDAQVLKILPIVNVSDKI